MLAFARGHIQRPLRSMRPVRIQLVSHSEMETCWDQLVKKHHYLGYQRLLGHRLKYLAFMDDQPVAALSFSAPALKLRVRDDFIGWRDDERKANLHRIVNNSRFVILARVRNLGSHVLGLTLRRLNDDWQEYFNCKLWLVESFVDPTRFQGTVYKASNWTFLGYSHGYGKHGMGYIYHGRVKEVYVYVLNLRFRDILGCQQRPSSPFKSPPSSIKHREDLLMIVRHNVDWNPDLLPVMDLTEQDTENLADALLAFHGQFHDCFGRIEHHRLGFAYIAGLLSNSEAKSVEPMALELLDSKGVRPLQRFMKGYRWDHEAMLHIHQGLLVEKIGQASGMITVDASDFAKKGKESVGVARQYCGSLGKTENCQSGVFVGYSSEKGYGLVGCRLYMPKDWFTPEYEERRTANLVPEDVEFQTKNEIALDLIKQVAKHFPAQWIGCDAAFGSDSNFLKSLPENLWYFAAVRSTELVFLEKPVTGIPSYSGKGRPPQKPQVLSHHTPISLKELAQSQDIAWTPTILQEGAKGPNIAHVATMRVYPSRDGLPAEEPVWLFLRKNLDGEVKYAFSNAPEDISFNELCRASILRWPIEQSFQEGKSQVGMDHYEHRSWPAWHRHMIYVFLALHFLLDLQILFKKKLQS